MGLFGGGGKDMEMPSAQDLYDQAEGYYANYGQWIKAATDQYERDISMNKASYGAAGGRGDDAYLKKINDARATSYHETLAELEGGEHGKYLTNYFNKAKEAVLEDYAPKKKAEVGTGILAGVDMDWQRGSGYGTDKYFSDVETPGRKQARELQSQIFELEESGKPQTAVG
ncbi:MAG: hypothetical protein DRP45_12020, partial [Candidatus Zixiibacteriota bacterium]